MPFHISVTAMDPLGPNSADFPALSIASLGTMSLMMQVQLTVTHPSTPITTPATTTVDDEYSYFSSPSPPYSPTTPTPPPTFVQGVVIVLRVVRPKPHTPPSLRCRSNSASSVHSVTVIPTAPVTLPHPSRVCVRRSLPRARYFPPEKSLCQGVFTTLPFVFGLPGSGPRRSKRCREEEGEDGWLDWLVMCRRKKRRAV